jgi:hypothetical protein
MGEVDRDNGAAYLRALGRVARWARLAVVLRRLLAGSLAGLAAGLAYLAARPFLPSSFTLVHPLVVPGLLLAAGGLAGAGVGCAVRIHRAALAVQADRSLGTPGLASAALELAEGRRASAFAGPLLEDAASGLRSAGPRRILGRTRLRLLPWALAAAVVVAVTGLLPWNLRDLFPARPPVDRRIAVLGEELEESGRRLEEEARRLDLREGLELSRELQSLGKDLQMQEGSPEELARRLSELERRIGSEYELMLQRFYERQQPGGEGAGGETAAEGGEAEAAPGSGQGDAGGDASRDAPGAVDPSTLPPEARELAEARDLLRQLKERSVSSSGSGTGSEHRGSPGDREGAGEGTAAAGGDEAAGVEGDPSASPEAGTSPVADEPGAPSEIASPKPGEPLAAESVVGEGEMARMLVRALPEAAGAATAEEEALAEYRKQAESALTAEQVPLELREYVKGYFTGIGVLRP